MEFQKEEDSEILKENLSIGYLNHSILSRNSYENKLQQTKNTNISMINMKSPNLEENLFEKTILQKYLNIHKKFQENQRLFIWKNILQLPENKEAYNNLVNRGILKEFQNLYKKYQLSSENLFRKLQRISSCLCIYCPAFLDVPFLQDMIFPFIKLFSHNELWCFETILSFFLNWLKHFFDYSPEPPVHYFKNIDEIVKFITPELNEFMIKSGVSSLILLWPSMQVLFTDILEKNEWLSLMDYLIVSKEHPELFMYFAASILTCSKSNIIENSSNEIQPLSFYLKSLSVENLIKVSEKIRKTLPKNFISLNFNNNDIPMNSGQYPIHDFYPKFDLYEHRKMRENIVQEEEKWLEEKKRLNLLKIQNLTNEFLQKQDLLSEKWYSFKNKIEEEGDLLKMEQDLMLKKKLELEEAQNLEKIKKIEAMENKFVREVKRKILDREQEKEMVEKELQYNKQKEDIKLATKYKDEALNKLQFQSIMKLNELVKEREIEIDHSNHQKKKDFYEAQNFFINSIENEKQKEVLHLMALKSELDAKKEAVQDHFQKELIEKRNISNEMILMQMKQELEDAHEKKMKDLNLVLEKEKTITKNFENLKKKIINSDFDKEYNQTFEKDEKLEDLKNSLREELWMSHHT